MGPPLSRTTSQRPHAHRCVLRVQQIQLQLVRRSRRRARIRLFFPTAQSLSQIRLMLLRGRHQSAATTKRKLLKSEKSMLPALLLPLSLPRFVLNPKRKQRHPLPRKFYSTNPSASPCCLRPCVAELRRWMPPSNLMRSLKAGERLAHPVASNLAFFQLTRELHTARFVLLIFRPLKLPKRPAAREPAWSKRRTQSDTLQQPRPKTKGGPLLPSRIHPRCFRAAPVRRPAHPPAAARLPRGPTISSAAAPMLRTRPALRPSSRLQPFRCLLPHRRRTAAWHQRAIAATRGCAAVVASGEAASWATSCVQAHTKPAPARDMRRRLTAQHLAFAR